MTTDTPAAISAALLKLVRPDILKMPPYQSADWLLAQQKQPIKMRLDANLSPFAPYPPQANSGLNQYQPPQPPKLLKLLAKIYNINSRNLLIGRGSDEGIDLLLRTFCVANVDSIIICPPTFGMYAYYAKLQGAKIYEAPLVAADNYQLDSQKLLQLATQKKAKMIFIPNPQAPLGHWLPPKAIIDLCRQLAGQCLVVVDEAYIEFCEAASLSSMIDQHPNLVILRTLSKAYAMAGLRLGCLIAVEPLIKILQLAQAPYPLTVSSVNIAYRALQPDGLAWSRQNIAKIIVQRQWLQQKLATLGYVQKVFDTVTNFILLQVDNHDQLMAKTAEQGIILRSQHSQLANTIRISIGTPQQNKVLWQVLQSI